MNEVSRLETIRILSQVDLMGKLLDSAKDAEITARGNQRMAERLKQGLVSFLWEFLPPYVTAIELGETTVTKFAKDVGFAPNVPPKTWSLSDVDRYAASLAAKVNKPWQPRFQ